MRMNMYWRKRQYPPLNLIFWAGMSSFTRLPIRSVHAEWLKDIIDVIMAEDPGSLYWNR
jgi:hypothetical protein